MDEDEDEDEDDDEDNDVDEDEDEDDETGDVDDTTPADSAAPSSTSLRDLRPTAGTAETPVSGRALVLVDPLRSSTSPSGTLPSPTTSVAEEVADEVATKGERAPTGVMTPWWAGVCVSEPECESSCLPPPRPGDAPIETEDDDDEEEEEEEEEEQEVEVEAGVNGAAWALSIGEPLTGVISDEASPPLLPPALLPIPPARPLAAFVTEPPLEASPGLSRRRL